MPLRVLLLALLLAPPLGGAPALGADPGTAPKAAAPTVRDLAALLEPIRARHDLPALGGAVVTVERLTALGVVGVRRRGGTEAVTPDDRWHLGSCTKAMTATLCAILVEERTLAFDRTVPAGLGRLAKDIDAGWATSTLELLLQNRGGVAGDVDGRLWAELWRREGSSRAARARLVRGTLAAPPAYTPGTASVYSNASYSLAGAMAEEGTDEAWEDLMRTRLFVPLGMDRAGFGAPGTADGAGADEPWGHRPQDGTPVPPGALADNPAAIGPAGRVHASLADWARFVALHLRRGTGEPRPLPPSAFARLQRVAGDARDGYAMGWLVTHRDWGGRVLTHAGSNTLWYAVTWLAPERGFAVLVATNTGGAAAPQATDEAAWALIQDHQRPTAR